MRKAVAFLGAAVVAVGVWACSDDPSQPGTPLEVEPNQARGGGAACDLSATLDAARRYLNTPYQNQVTGKLSTIQTNGCTGLANEQLAWEVLGIVETVVEAGAGNDASYGTRLVNGVLSCCVRSGSSFTVDAKVLGAGGLFGVRGMLGATNLQDDGTVLSREPVSILFGGEGGVQPVVREAIVALKPREGSWARVAAGSGDPTTTYTDEVMLLTGFPLGTSPHAEYELDEVPDLGFQSGAQVDVIICFVDDLSDPANADPHPPEAEGAGYQARLKRNGSVVLQPVVGAETFCNGVRAQQVAAITPAQRMMTALADAATDLIMPEPLGAFFTDRTTIGFGGGAGFFSRFKGSTPLTTGSRLEFVQGPPNVVQSTTTPFTIQVRARTGDGAPLELVTVTARILNNNGQPAGLSGSFLTCANTTVTSPALGCTKETANADAIASITMTSDKAGGYAICVSGTSNDGFTFPEVCFPRRFNVRN
jgi:hypothetical protein